eukprot:8897367-Pyramimonas_sp.AAC.1
MPRYLVVSWAFVCTLVPPAASFVYDVYLVAFGAWHLGGLLEALLAVSWRLSGASWGPPGA